MFTFFRLVAVTAALSAMVTVCAGLLFVLGARAAGEIEKIELQLQRLEETIRANAEDVGRMKRRLAKGKDGIERLGSVVFYQMDFIPARRRGGWNLVGGTFVYHNNIVRLWRKYEGEFIRYKAARGEETYTLKELSQWLKPREEKYIRQLEARLPELENTLEIRLRLRSRLGSKLRRERAKLVRIKRDAAALEAAIEKADEKLSHAGKDSGEPAAVEGRTRKEDIAKINTGREEQHKARRRAGGDQTRPQQTEAKPACDALGGEWRGGTLNKVQQLAAQWRKGLSSCTAGPDCPRYRGRVSFQSYMRTMMIWQCHATFIKLSKSASGDDRKLAWKEGCAIEATLEKMADQIKVSGFMKAGSGWTPLHVEMLEAWGAKTLCDPAPEPQPAAEARTGTDCKGGGLVGAMNCVAKKIEGAGMPPASASSTDPATGITTTSVRNADGTRTVTRTDRTGKVLSEEIVGKSPASASSTDPATGITTRSMGNADGTHTVTKTDRNGNVISEVIVHRDRQGNVLSRERVR